MLSVQEIIKNGMLIDEANKLNPRIVANLLLFFTAESFETLVQFLESFLDDFNHDENTALIVGKLRDEEEIANVDTQKKQKIALKWMRKNLSRLRNSDAYHDDKVQKVVEDAYRFVSLTKTRVGLKSKYELIRTNEYSTYGFVMTGWWKFREACSAVAMRGEFEKLAKIAKCKLRTEPPVYIKAAENSFGEILYPGGADDKLPKHETSFFVKAFDYPIKHFDENCDIVPHRKIVVVRGEIEEFIVPDYLNFLFPKSSQTIQALFQTSPLCSLVSLKNLVELGKIENKQIDCQAASLEVLENDSRHIWRRTAREKAEALRGAEFKKFHQEVSVNVGRLILLFARETVSLRELDCKKKDKYLARWAKGIATEILRAVFYRFRSQSKIEFSNKKAVEEGKVILEGKNYPELLKRRFSGHVWDEAIAIVCNEEGWVSKVGCKKGTKTRKISMT